MAQSDKSTAREAYELSVTNSMGYSVRRRNGETREVVRRQECGFTPRATGGLRHLKVRVTVSSCKVTPAPAESVQGAFSLLQTSNLRPVKEARRVPSHTASRRGGKRNRDFRPYTTPHKCFTCLYK